MENNIQSTLSRLRDEFIAKLPERIAALQTLLDEVARGEPESFESLHRAAHSLVGTAGTHRLMQVSEAARDLERIAATLPANAKVNDADLRALHTALANLATQTANPTCSLAPAPMKRRTTARIMVVEDDQEQASWLRSVLEQEGYQVETFGELAAFRTALQGQELPAAVIMDMVFPEGDDAGARIIAEMKLHSLNVVPVIFLSVRQDMAAKLAAHRAGATRYLTKPVDREVLLRVIADSAALTPAQPYRILMVDDDRSQLAVNSQLLRHAGMEVRETDHPLQVLGMLEEFAAEALLLDMHMPQCSGVELAAILHDDERFAAIPIVYLSSETDISRQLLALDRGGDHFLVKPVNPAHLVAVIGMHARRFRQSMEQTESLRAARYERERQQQALDAHAIVSATDPAGKIISVNDKFCEVSGYSREELLGNNHRIVKSGMHPPELYADMWRTIKSGHIWHGEVCNKRKDGGLYWVATSIAPFMDNEGRPYQYISIRTDITRLKRQEEALRSNEAQLRMLLDNAADAVFVAGKDERWIYVNTRAVALLGYSREELLGMSIYDLVPADWRETYRQNFREKLLTDGLMHQEIRLIKKDGRKIPIEMNAAVLPDGTVYGSCRDVSARKEAEAARQEALDRLQKIAGRVPGVVFQFRLRPDGSSCFPFASEATRELFRVSPEEIREDASKVFAICHPDDFATLMESIQLSARNLAPWHHEVRTKFADGTMRWLSGNALPQREEDGSVLWHGFINDITERKKIDEALLAAKDAAESASRAKSEFLASMSHELRTPLNAILGFSQLFTMDARLPQETRDNAHEIERAGQHLLSLINDMIDLARIEAGRIELSLEPVQVGLVLRNSLAMVESLARNKGVRLIDAECENREVTVLADHVRLRQVLINLISNAIKYNKPQGTVSISCRTHAGMVRISVADTGQGIPADKQGRIFNAFDRLGEERGNVEGTGIGLVITKRIVEAMGGNIGFESTAGQGSTFWVEFPLTTAASLHTPHATSISPLRDDACNPQTDRPVVLYIEDNPMNLRLMQQVFAGMNNLELRHTETAELGIGLAQAQPPALILMDINLPGMDGYAALAALKADARTARIPVIAITANAMKGDEERGLAAGFTDYLTKPIDIPALLATLGKLGEQHGART